MILGLLLSGAPVHAEGSAPSVFACYSAEGAPQVLPLEQALAAGLHPFQPDPSAIGSFPVTYWQPYAVDPRGMPSGVNDLEGPQLGPYKLQCTVQFGMQDTGSAVGGSGEIYDAPTVAAYRSESTSEGLGIYEIFRWVGLPIGVSGGPCRRLAAAAVRSSCTSSRRGLLPSGGMLLSSALQVTGCIAHGRAPDRACSPGVVYVGATRTTLCAKGFRPLFGNPSLAAVRRIRASYSLGAKDAYNVTLSVPLSLGGTNDDPNLWPIMRSERAALNAKTRLEKRLRTMVCNGSVDLLRAQRQLAADWQKLYRRLFGRPPLPTTATLP